MIDMLGRFRSFRLVFLMFMGMLMLPAVGLAQTCLGRPMPKASGVGLHYTNADLDDELSLYTYEIEYVRQTELFGYGSTGESALRVAIGVGDLKPSVTKDAMAVYLGGLYTFDSQLDPTLTYGVALCMTTGLEFQSYDTGVDILGVDMDRQYLSLPIQLNAGYPVDVPFGRLVGFLAPTVNLYTARWKELHYGYFGPALYEVEKRGMDFYFDLGVGLTTGPVNLRVAYRGGDNYYDEKGRFAASLDVLF